MNKHFRSVGLLVISALSSGMMYAVSTPPPSLMRLRPHSRLVLLVKVSLKMLRAKLLSELLLL